MFNYTASIVTGIVTGMVILAVAIPYVMRIRHPQQKPLAAYLIFVSVFLMAAGILFNTLGWLVGMFDLESALARPGPAVLFLAMVFLPAIVLATYLARKPPWRQDPPL